MERCSILSAETGLLTCAKKSMENILMADSQSIVETMIGIIMKMIQLKHCRLSRIILAAYLWLWKYTVVRLAADCCNIHHPYFARSVDAIRVNGHITISELKKLDFVPLERRFSPYILLAISR